MNSHTDRTFDGISGTISTALPIGAGLSSSASLMVAIAIALGFDGSAVELAQLRVAQKLPPLAYRPASWTNFAS